MPIPFEQPSPEELREFIESLSGTVRVAHIDARVSLDGETVVLGLTYRLAADEESDGKPIVLGVPTGPFRVLTLDCVGAIVGEVAEREDMLLFGAICYWLEPVAGRWSNSEIALRLAWIGPQDDESAEHYLAMPERLPAVVTANQDGFTAFDLPGFTVSFDPDAERLLGGGIAVEKWPDGYRQMTLVQALLIDPDYETVPHPIAAPWDETVNAVRITRSAATTMSQEEREAVPRIVTQSLPGLQRVFGPRLVTRMLIVHESELLIVGTPGSSTTIPCSLGLETDWFQNLIHLWQRLSHSWWGTGMRTTGPHTDVIRLGIMSFAAGIIRHALSGSPVDIERALSLNESKQAPVKLAMGIAWPLLAALRDDSGRRDSFRTFVRGAWGKSIPEGQFIDWCAANGISIPAELQR